MRIDQVIEFAQQRFGPDADLVSDTETGPALPDWLIGRAGEATPLQESDEIAIEGEVSAEAEPDPTPDGTTPDNLALYLPFHFYKTSWGIYIRAAGVWALARRLAAGRVDVTALMAAYLILLEHERLHFTAEYGASRIEVVTGQSSYREYFRDVDATEHEEALANASAMRELRRYADARVVAAVVSWMRSQPPGYRDFEQCMPPRFVAEERRSATFMSMRAAVINRLLGHGSLPAEFLFRRSPRRGVPIYMVLDASVLWMRLVKPFPKDFGIQVFVHSNDHKPPHIHIQAPPGKERTRYRWPELTPLDRDPPLRVTERKGLQLYIAKYGTAIDQRVKAIPWQ